MQKYTIETVLKSDPNIRHLFDVACPLHFDNKQKINGIMIICKSVAIRTFIVDILKSKSQTTNFTSLDIDRYTKCNELLMRITGLENGTFILYENSSLQVNEHVKKMLGRIIGASTYQIRVGKGTMAKYVDLPIPEHTHVFVCEHNSEDSDYLSKYCEHIITIDDFQLKTFCEPVIAALINEQNITCDASVIKSIASKYSNNVDLCLRCVRRISDFFKLHSIENKELTMSLLIDIDGTMPCSIELERNKLLKHISSDVKRLHRDISKLTCDGDEIEYAEIIDRLDYIAHVLSESTKDIREEQFNQYYHIY